MSMILRVILLIELSLYLISSALCRMFISLSWVESLAAALVVPFVFRAGLLATTFLLAFKFDAATRGLRGWTKAIWREFIAPIAFLSFYGPFEKFLLKDSTPTDSHDKQKPVVILVHGYLSNRGVWWRLLPYLKHQGFYVVAINLRSTLGSIDEFVNQLNNTIAKHRQITGQRDVALVGHSMGGLVCRAWLARFEDNNVATTITIATPHQGTALSSVAIGRCGKQMQTNSKWLNELEHSEARTGTLNIVSIRSNHDNVVVPSGLAALERGENMALSGLGHFSLVTNSGVLRRVSLLISFAKGFSENNTTKCK